MKTKQQKKYKEYKLQTSISQEHKRKTPQQNISKSNPAIYEEKNNNLLSTVAYSGNARLI